MWPSKSPLSQEVETFLWTPMISLGSRHLIEEVAIKFPDLMWLLHELFFDSAKLGGSFLFSLEPFRHSLPTLPMSLAGLVLFPLTSTYPPSGIFFFRYSQVWPDLTIPRISCLEHSVAQNIYRTDRTYCNVIRIPRQVSTNCISNLWRTI